MPAARRFFIKTFGCQMNVNDSEKMRFLLGQRGLTPAGSEAEADVVIVNSCAVREKAQEKIYSYIGRLPARVEVVVAGCVAQAEGRDIFKRNPRVRRVVGTHQFHRIADLLGPDQGGDSRRSATAFSRDWREVVPDAAARESPVTAYLSIMEGCDNFCSYCIVPFTRGREKYRSFSDIRREAADLAAAGYREIVLLGQNVNSWRDGDGGLGFADLLDILAREVEVDWIRFITSYPGYFEGRLIEVVARHARIARHMHFPAQSGSTRILRRMNRAYTRADYLDVIGRFRRSVPGFKFSSDFIVGFPGETERDFDLTLSLVRRVEFESIFSFVYSPRRHTRALGLGDGIDPAVKKARLRRLQDLQAAIQLKNNRDLIGREVDVLVTHPHPRARGEVVGRTESHRVVNFPSTAAPGEFRRVRVETVGPHSLRGRETDPE